MPTDDAGRFMPDLINISESERDMIIKWAEYVRDEWGLMTEEEDLLERFTQWKEDRDEFRKRSRRRT